MGSVSLTFSQRDILLVPFPFSNQSYSKVRPALVISNNSFNNQSKDVLVCGITSKYQKNYAINLSTENLEEGEIKIKSSVKVQNIAKLDKKLFFKKIGKVNIDTLNQIKHQIQTLLT